jgi:hypothetical protein
MNRAASVDFDLWFACKFCHCSCLVCHGCIIRTHVNLNYKLVIDLNYVCKAALFQSLMNHGSR